MPLKLTNAIADPYDPMRPSRMTPPVSKIEIHKGPNFTDKTNKTLIVEGIPAGISLFNSH